MSKGCTEQTRLTGSGLGNLTRSRLCLKGCILITRAWPVLIYSFSYISRAEYGYVLQSMQLGQLPRTNFFQEKLWSVFWRTTVLQTQLQHNDGLIINAIHKVEYTLPFRSDFQALANQLGLELTSGGRRCSWLEKNWSEAHVCVCVCLYVCRCSLWITISVFLQDTMGRKYILWIQGIGIFLTQFSRDAIDWELVLFDSRN